MTNQNQNGMTQEQQEMARLRALLEEQKATIAKLEAENSSVKEPQLTVKVPKYSNGAIGIYGIQKFPVSVYPKAVERLARGVEMVKEFVSQNPNVIRASMFAAEYARKVLGMDPKAEIPAKSSSNRAAWEKAWDDGYLKAMTDPSLVPSRK